MRLDLVYRVGKVEDEIYKLRKSHPLIIPQLDPDKYHDRLNDARQWFENVKKVGISIIAMGGSVINPLDIQKLLDLATKEYDLFVILYLTTSIGSIIGKKDRTAIYWAQVPTALNTFYTWDGLISNSLSVERCELEPLPTVYVFDDRNTLAASNWITRIYPIPRKKPEISLAVAKAAQYMGVRFYIMAGGSGSELPPPSTHIEMLAKRTDLFVIPTSGIKTIEHVNEVFSAGADAIHIGNVLEGKDGFKLLSEMVKIANKYPGRSFV
jgi:phosphoglycerol geranylgeranyltransferase